MGQLEYASNNQLRIVTVQPNTNDIDDKVSCRSVNTGIVHHVLEELECSESSRYDNLSPLFLKHVENNWQNLDAVL